ncbi:MAG: hypothetical protein GTO14_14470, partial [Anaerolineales bacterium]|nr:hypothetical protein [Anaerolineales bacterium]
MMNLSELPRRELERLSAYLDGALSRKEAARLEARLQDEPELRAALEELRETVWLLRSVPELKPPRRFALSPEMVGVRERPRAYPRLQLATALVAAAFVFVIGIDLFGSAGMQRGMAPAAERDVAGEAVPMEAPAVEKEAQEIDAAPAEEFVGGEEEKALAEPEIEVPATIEEAEEGLFRFAEPETTEVPPAAVEDEMRAEAPPPVSTVGDVVANAEGELAAEELGMAEGAAEAEGVSPTIEPTVLPPSEVEEPSFYLEPQPPS